MIRLEEYRKIIITNVYQSTEHQTNDIIYHHYIIFKLNLNRLIYDASCHIIFDASNVKLLWRHPANNVVLNLSPPKVNPLVTHQLEDERQKTWTRVNMERDEWTKTPRRRCTYSVNLVY